MKIYLSGPMKNTGPEFNFPAFDAAAARFRGLGWEVVNPAELDRTQGYDPAWPSETYMRRDLPELVHCDAIALLPDWRRSAGANKELAVARMCGLLVLDAETTKMLQPESILQEAHRLVHGPRGDDYDHPHRDFSRTGRMWGAILDEWRSSGPDAVPPQLVALCMVALKISREVHKPKRDNRVDGAGYLETEDMVLDYVPSVCPEEDE